MNIYAGAVSRRAKVAAMFGLVTVFGLLDFSYHYLDHLARGRNINPLIPFVEELTGCYSALVLIIPAAWVARRYRNVAAHLPALALGSVAHTSLMWGSRTVLFPMLGLGAYDYGLMPTRYFMEFGSDLLVYATAV